MPGNGLCNAAISRFWTPRAQTLRRRHPRGPTRCAKRHPRLPRGDAGSMLDLRAPRGRATTASVRRAWPPPHRLGLREPAPRALRVPASAVRRGGNRASPWPAGEHQTRTCFRGQSSRRAERESRRPDAASNPITGNAYSHGLAQLPVTWEAAIDAFGAMARRSPASSSAELIAKLPRTPAGRNCNTWPAEARRSRPLYLDTVWVGRGAPQRRTLHAIAPRHAPFAPDHRARIACTPSHHGRPPHDPRHLADRPCSRRSRGARRATLYRSLWPHAGPSRL